MNKRALLAAVWAGLVSASISAAPPDGVAGGGKFTRFQEDSSGSRLQTGVGSYRNPDGVTVDLIGAIHIGDKAYYQKLNQRFSRYEALLYEMVGESYETRLKRSESQKRVEAAERRNLEVSGQKARPGADSSVEERIVALEKNTVEEATGITPLPTEEDHRQVAEAKKEAAAGGNLAWVHPLYETMEKTLGLTGQMNGIDYTGGNFVHADMTLREFSAMQREKDESFITLWWKSVVVQMAHPEAAPEQPGLLKIMESLCRGEGSLGLRRAAARTFGSIEGVLSGLETEDGTVILTERNKVALGVLQEQIKLGKKDLAIFYGAAHLADMEKRLLAMGFVRTGGEWFNAWDMPPEPK